MTMLQSNGLPRLRSPTFHLTFLLIFSLFFTILVVSILTKIEIIAQGTGKIIPVARIQVVQPEYAGQIRAINVSNGDHVNKGEVLVALDSTEATASVDSLQTELRQLEIEKKGIETALVPLGQPNPGRDLDPERVLASFSLSHATPQTLVFYKEQKQALAAQLTRLKADLDQAAANIAANDKSEEVTKANITQAESALATQKERLENAKTLMKNGAGTRAAYLDALDAYDSLQQKEEVYQHQLAQKQAEAIGLAAARKGLIDALRSTMAQRRVTVEKNITSVSDDLWPARRKLKNTRLVASVSGTVAGLKVFTIGGVVKAGETLMQIVPSGNQLELDTYFSNSDIGFMSSGQKANISLDAFPASRFGYLKGHVTDLSADATDLGNNKWAFEVRIVPTPGRPR